MAKSVQGKAHSSGRVYSGRSKNSSLVSKREYARQVAYDKSRRAARRKKSSRSKKSSGGGSGGGG